VANFLVMAFNKGGIEERISFSIYFHFHNIIHYCYFEKIKEKKTLRMILIINSPTNKPALSEIEGSRSFAIN